MRIENSTEIDGLKIVTLEPFIDERGWYAESYNEKDFQFWTQETSPEGIMVEKRIQFVQDSCSFTRKGVLRGLHADRDTWKLVTCLHGLVKYVAADCRPTSETFGKYFSCFLGYDLSLNSEKGFRTELLIPPGCASGFYALKKSIYFYKQSTYYRGKDSQFTLSWNDPTVGVDWRLPQPPILSKRDHNGMTLDECGKWFGSGK